MLRVRQRVNDLTKFIARLNKLFLIRWNKQTIFAEPKNRYKLAIEFSKGDILDMNAGIGLGIPELKKSKRKFTCVEELKSCRDVAKKLLGYTILSSLDRLKNKKFETVLLLQVLEHMEHPKKYIKKIAKKCKKGGTFIFSVPKDKELDDDTHLWQFDFYDCMDLAKLICKDYKIYFINKSEEWNKGSKTWDTFLVVCRM